jgi:hypothetical protein
MDRNDRHRAGFLVDVEAIGDQLRFALRDEVHEPLHARFQLTERASVDIGMVDVDDRLRVTHG